MPIRIYQINEETRTCQVIYGDEVGHIEYKLAAYTPELEDRVQTDIESNRPSGAMAEALAGLLVSWDVLGDDGDPLPIDRPTLRSLPARFLTAIFEAIKADQEPEVDDRKNSGATLPRRANKGA